MSSEYLGLRVLPALDGMLSILIEIPVLNMLEFVHMQEPGDCGQLNPITLPLSTSAGS